MKSFICDKCGESFGWYKHYKDHVVNLRCTGSSGSLPAIKKPPPPDYTVGYKAGYVAGVQKGSRKLRIELSEAREMLTRCRSAIDIFRQVAHEDYVGNSPSVEEIDEVLDKAKGQP